MNAIGYAILVFFANLAALAIYDWVAKNTTRINLIISIYLSIAVLLIMWR